MREARIEEAATADDFALGRILFEEYAASVGVDLCFQNFAAELENLASIYSPPGGALLIATIDSDAAGCVGVRRFSDDVCEMKRLYVRPAYRGWHLGRRLAEAIVERGRGLNYNRMVLDTLESMQIALALYGSIGFQPSAAYYPNPLPGVKYLALDLGQRLE